MVLDKEKESEVELTLEAVRGFLLKHNGKVKHVDLGNHFRSVLTSSQAREDFKNILQLITAIKTENGDKYVVLINNTHDKFQNSVISRKANRPLSVRKEIAKSRHDYLMAPFASRGYQSDDDDTTSVHSSVSAASEESNDSGIGVEMGSLSSVSLLRNALSMKIKDSSKSKSMDSIDKISADVNEELDDEIDMGVEILPEEKEWFLASSTGRIELLKKLLEKHPKLSKNRDFVLGYTALHWAAKLGRADIVKLIIQSGVDVHSKSHGGYTPLHVAAMSGKDQVITQLIELHNASIHERDHSGKKPKDLVKETVSADVQRKLGRSVILVPDWVISDFNPRKGSSMMPQYRKE